MRAEMRALLAETRTILDDAATAEPAEIRALLQDRLGDESGSSCIPTRMVTAPGYAGR